MQIAETFTGVTQKLGMMVQKPISHLLIVASGTGVANILNAEITVDITEKSTTENIIPGTRLDTLAAALGRVDGLGVYIDTSGVHYLTIALARGGGLNLVSGNYLKVNLTGLTSTVSHEVYGIESDNNSGYRLKYVNLDMNADKNKWSNDGYEYLVMPKTNLKSLKLYCSTDGTPEFLPKELIAHNMIEGEVSYISEASAATSKQSLLLINDITVVNLDNVKSFEVERVAGSSYKFVAIDWVK